MEVIGCSSVRSIGIYYWTVRAAVQVVYEVLDTLERWCVWGRIMARETVYRVHGISAGVFHNVADSHATG